MNKKNVQIPLKKKGVDIIQTEEEPLPENGSDIFNMSNGGKYVGEWKRFENILKKHGKGILTCENFIYEGYFEEDFFHGIGKLKFKDGSVYNGNFNHGNISGKGEMKFIDGSIYNGNWRDGKMHGIGTFLTIFDEKWTGMWNNGMSNCPIYPQIIPDPIEEDIEEEILLEEESIQDE